MLRLAHTTRASRPLFPSASSANFPHIVPNTFSKRTQATQAAQRAVVGDIKTVGVIGAGQMGVGIAYVAAKVAGTRVLISDRCPQQLSKALAFIDSLLSKEVKKGRLQNDAASIVRERIGVVEGDGLKEGKMDDVDLAIEAVSEHLPTKQAIFSSLATYLRPQAILASNTSSISLSTLAASAITQEGKNRSNQVVGFHFFNPVPVMKLVELIPALQTDPAVLETARSFAQKMGKTVVQSADSPGFISNRLLMPYINEAVIALETGVASKEDIDTTMKLGMNHPMGPLQLADFIGLDTCLSIMRVLQEETGDSKYRPSVLLGRMVSANYLGKKSGQGFFSYPSSNSGSHGTSPPPPSSPPQKVSAAAADEVVESPPPYGISETKGEGDVDLKRLSMLKKRGDGRGFWKGI
ncbi:hypothetical protein JCM11641_005380 [Rhodosporidiobolus odoratus]